MAGVSQAPLIPSDETKALKRKTPFAMHLEEYWVKLVVHSDAPDVCRDAGVLRDFEKVEGDVGLFLVLVQALAQVLFLLLELGQEQVLQNDILRHVRR